MQDLEENARLIQEQQQEASLAVAKYAQVSKQTKKQSSADRSGDRQYYDKQYSYGDQGYHSGGHRSKQQYSRDRSPGVQQQQQQQYSQERLQAARQAQEVVQCAKGDLSEQQDTRGAIQLKQNWLELWLEKRLEIVLCCAEKQCASSCRRGSNLSHCFSVF